MLLQEVMPTDPPEGGVVSAGDSRTAPVSGRRSNVEGRNAVGRSLLQSTVVRNAMGAHDPVANALEPGRRRMTMYDSNRRSHCRRAYGGAVRWHNESVSRHADGGLR